MTDTCVHPFAFAVAQQLADLFMAMPIISTVDGATGQKRNNAIVLALSGGGDSTALLVALQQTQDIHKLDIQALHVNHGLRGKESDSDEAFCRSLCLANNIELIVINDRVRCNGLDQAFTISENALRERRYKYLSEAAQTAGAGAIVTAHTLDDQAETIIFRLVRGTSLSGVSGIKKMHRLQSDKDLFLLRPMLSLPRSEIDKFLLDCAINARHDASNDKLNFSRNYIRHNVLSAIKNRFPMALKNIQRFSEIVYDEEEFIGQIVAKIFLQLTLCANVWPSNKLRSLPKALLRRCIACGLTERKIAVTFYIVEKIAALIASDQRKLRRFSLSERWDVQIDHHELIWYDKNQIQTIANNIIDFEIPLKMPGTTVILPLTRALRAEVVSRQKLDPKRQDDNLKLLADLHKVPGPLVLRRRRAGDFLQPFGMAETVSLKKYLHTHKAIKHTEKLRLALTPDWSPSSCIVLCQGSEVLWVPGIGFSEKLRAGKQPLCYFEFVELAKDVHLA